MTLFCGTGAFEFGSAAAALEATFAESERTKTLSPGAFSWPATSGARAAATAGFCVVVPPETNNSSAIEAAAARDAGTAKRMILR
ncbi:MAG: hypothetical protein ACKOD5_14425, partial [Chthoniobacterales bacterium]